MSKPHIDSFTTISPRKGRRKATEKEVLAEIAAAGRISVWDLSPQTDALFRRGLIRRTGGSFPWIKIDVIEPTTEETDE